MLNFENLKYGVFYGFNDLGIPETNDGIYDGNTGFIPFNYALTCTNPSEKGVHFFLDDYQFQRVWNKPAVYINILKKFKCVLSPDFSTYTDMPVAMQIYNHYRKQYMDALWQLNGINVINTVSWSDESSFQWCFMGVPKHSTVAISNVGCNSTEIGKKLFMEGFRRMKEEIHPKKILLYGTMREGLEECEYIGNRITEQRERCGKKWEEEAHPAEAAEVDSKHQI